jgi:hypothetical protein
MVNEDVAAQQVAPCVVVVVVVVVHFLSFAQAVL